MTNPPPPPEFAHYDARRRAVIATDVPVAEQIRRSLDRQRRQGVGFELAWRQSIGSLEARNSGRGGTVALPHERSEREAWYAVLGDPLMRECWAAAYERRPMAALDAVEVLGETLQREERAA